MNSLNTGKVSWLRPVGTLIFALSVLAIHAFSYPLPFWADAIAVFMLATWFIDRSLWKFIPLLKGYKNGE